MPFSPSKDQQTRLLQLLEKLKPYGKVETCQIWNDQLHVKITDGFSNTGANPFELGQEIIALFPEYPTIHKYEVDANLFHLVLKPNP